jgi:LPS export ABC transporter permease LptG
MPILFRWIFYGCLGRTLATMAALLAIYIIIELFDKSRYLGHGLSGSLLAEYLLLKMPFMLSEFMPVIMLLAAGIYISEISHHQELVAMRAAGLGLNKVAAPILSVALLVATFSFIIGEWITPITNTRLDVIERVHIQHRNLQSHQGVQWLRDGQRFFRLTPLGGDRFAMMMLKTDANGAWKQRVDAAQAIYRAGNWSLSQVYISEPEAREGMQLHFEEKMTLPSATGPDTAAPPSPRHMRFSELYRYAENLKRAGLNASDFVFTLHRKFAAPAACLVMALLALALCMNMGSRIAATSWGLVSAISLGLLFYVMSNASGLLAGGDRLPAAYAAWLPLLVFGGLAGFLLLHREGK